MSITKELIQSNMGIESDPTEGPDAVCEQITRHWCEIIQETNPLYTDKEYAEASQYGELIAPPMQVQVYTMGPIWPVQEESGTNPMTTFIKHLKDAGFSSIVATGQEQEYFEPMKMGDRINNTVSLHECTPEKQTGRGPGHFVTFLYTYRNQRNEIVCKQSFQLFVYNAISKE